MGKRIEQSKMRTYEKTSYQEWTKRFGTERACLEAGNHVDGPTVLAFRMQLGDELRIRTDGWRARASHLPAPSKIQYAESGLS